jgi:hypothetical protein
MNEDDACWVRDEDEDGRGPSSSCGVVGSGDEENMVVEMSHQWRCSDLI